MVIIPLLLSLDPSLYDNQGDLHLIHSVNASRIRFPIITYISVWINVVRVNT